MKPISTPYDGRRWWDSNLRTPACKSPALPLFYGRRHPFICMSGNTAYTAGHSGALKSANTVEVTPFLHGTHQSFP